MKAKYSKTGKPTCYRDGARVEFQSEHARGLKTLAHTIKAARVAMKLTQVDVAYFLGVHQSLVSRIEQTGVIDHVLMERLALVLNEPLTHFKTLPDSTSTKERGRERVWSYYGRNWDWWQYVRENGTPPSEIQLTLYKNRLSNLERAQQKLRAARAEVRKEQELEKNRRAKRNAK